MTNFVEIGQARDKILSLKLDQVSGTEEFMYHTNDRRVVDLGHVYQLWTGYFGRPQGLFDILGQRRDKV